MVAVGEHIKVLVIEDEESYRQALSSGLRREGFDVALAEDGAAGLRLFGEYQPDIVLLDMLLPGMHGIEVCRRMRALSAVPIVMVSAVDSELDVVLGLELGASGYVTKPFRLRELVARMQRHPPARGAPDRVPRDGRAGRAGRHGSTTRRDVDARRAFGAVSVDFVRREVTVAGIPTHLSRREFDLLAVLLNPARRVRTRDELIDLLWPDRYLSDSRTLDTHIHRLRAKLEPDPTDPQYIVTVRGVGFRVDPDGTRGEPPVPRPRGDLADEGGMAATEPVNA